MTTTWKLLMLLVVGIPLTVDGSSSVDKRLSKLYETSTLIVNLFHHRATTGVAILVKTS